MAAWMGRALVGSDLQIITSTDEIAEGGACINYSNQHIDGAYQVQPSGLLAQKGIPPRVDAMSTVRNLPCFYHNQQNCQHGFDVLAASFYLLSRAEEYLPHSKDEYDRYPHTDSLAFRRGFLHRPLVDEWMSDLRNRLMQNNPQLQLKTPAFSWLPTYDVDQAWQYFGKNKARQLAGYLRDATQLKFGLLKERYRVSRNRGDDAFEVFDEILQHHQKMGVEPMFFWLVAAQQKGYDVNTPRNHSAYKTLLKHIHATASTGLHLSWAASRRPSLMHLEKNWLEKTVGESITKNRMHYIHFNLPHTFRQLLQAGIKEDYSMGYGSINGFRASTSQPFYWYDMEEERTTELLLHPFAWMDANSIFEMKETPQQSIVACTQMRDAVKLHGGRFITIAHNHLLGRDERGRWWWEMYRSLA